jgi:hypothetical protein
MEQGCLWPTVSRTYLSCPSNAGLQASSKSKRATLSYTQLPFPLLFEPPSAVVPLAFTIMSGGGYDAVVDVDEEVRFNNVPKPACNQLTLSCRAT